jgi:hypothetical protein
MNPFISSFNRSAPQPLARPAVDRTASLAATEAVGALGPNKIRYNPFLAAMNPDSPAFREMYGVNRPLEKPMLLGYRDGEPMYGGSRLFLLY